MFISAAAAVSFASTGDTGQDGFGLLAAAAIATSMVWRARWPLQICVGAAVAALLLPLDPLGPLVALSWVIATAGRRAITIASIATVAALVVASWRDHARDGEHVLFSAVVEGTGVREYLTPMGYAALGTVALAAAVGAGVARRYRSSADAALATATAEHRRAEALQTQAAELRTELSRQDERELIAREMHDTVAHHLSLVSLHASALEVTADDPGTDVGEAARSMRTSAHRALDEMRTLIASLRTAGDAFAEQYAGPAPRLVDLPRLVDDARAAGVDIGATVFVQQADDAPPALTRAVYRVVQESLTNAMKHAPGARVDVDVRARPGEGVDVVVRNARGTGGASEGGGAGLVGMRERAEALGGTFAAGPDGDAFVVRVHLPWATPTA